MLSFVTTFVIFEILKCVYTLYICKTNEQRVKKSRYETVKKTNFAD